MLNVFVTLLFVFWGTGAAYAEGWADKEARIGKALYIPEIKVVKPEALPSGLNSRLRNLGLEIVYVEERVEPGKYACTPISASDLQGSLDVLADALGKISDASLRRMQLEYLMLCDEAFARGMQIGGIPVPPLKLMMLSFGGADRAYQEHIFYHELYHYMEFMVARSTTDASWDSRYDGYGANGTDWTLGSADKDFVSAYAQSKPEEDRAEIFAHMIKNPKGFANYVAMQKSDVLTEKAAYIRQKVVNDFGVDSVK